MENADVSQVLAPALVPVFEPQVAAVIPHDKGFGCVRNIVSTHPVVCGILVVLVIILIVLSVCGMMKKSTDNISVIGPNYKVPKIHDAPPPKELKNNGVEKQTNQTYQESASQVSSQLRPDELSDNALVELLNGGNASDALPNDEYPHDE